MRDFTKAIYKKLLGELKEAQYEFVAFEEYLTKVEEKKKTVILRHDVDKSPGKALEMAEIENEVGVRGTYYFRVKEGEVREEEIKKMAAMGHEVGYHYEDLDVARGDVGKALELFKANLKRLREIVPVRTICMHGSPMSRFDNRIMWRGSDYRELGIEGEPYFDIDFDKVLYLTDTGRRWDGERVSIRDKVRGQRSGVRGERLEVRGKRSEVGGQRVEGRKNGANRRPKLHSTQDIISALRNEELSDQIMLTIHPQRWNDGWGGWAWEWLSQTGKNTVKYFVAKYRGGGRGER